MQHQKHQPKKKKEDFLATFNQVHKDVRPNQTLVIDQFPQHNQIILQAPTGTGKTALFYTFVKTNAGENGHGFYVCPNKTLVDGVVKNYPEIKAVYGRNEYDCQYYNNEYKADQIPCSMLGECPHRVDLETGQTFKKGAKPCQYLQAKYNSRRAPITACTAAYYFFEALGVETLPDALAIDEVHEWANSIRRMLSYKITDYRLDQFWELLCSIECRAEAKLVLNFKEAMIKVICQYTPGKFTTLLTDDNLKMLLKMLLKIQKGDIGSKIKKAIKEKKISPVNDRELLRDLDIFINDLYRYIRLLEFALEAKDRKPLSYVYGYWEKKLEEGKKIQYALNIQSYRIAGLTSAKLLPEKFLVGSATIGGDDARVFKMESGIDGHFIDLESDFPVENTKIFMSEDVPNLAVKSAKSNEKNRSLRKIIEGCVYGKKHGIRSLIIVISEEERQKILTFAKDTGLSVMTYNEEVKTRDAVQLFCKGQGDVLLGTEAQYGQGVDLPDDTCGFTFYLRPGYPTPDSPQAQFEERIYGNHRWSLWTWRVILKMMQARGRNVRSAKDKGCIFLMSQQFRRFTYGGMPKWLQPAYEGHLNFDQALKQGIKLLKK